MSASRRRQRLVDGPAGDGEASRYAAFFDIDWAPSNPDRAHKVLVPVLAGFLRHGARARELELRFEPRSGSFAVFYQSHRLPLDPRTYPRILDRVAALVSNTELGEHQTLAGGAPRPPGAHARTGGRAQPGERAPQAAPRGTGGRQAEVAAAMEAAVRSFGGTAAEPASFDALHELLELQAYQPPTGASRPKISTTGGFSM